MLRSCAIIRLSQCCHRGCHWDMIGKHGGKMGSGFHKHVLIKFNMASKRKQFESSEQEDIISEEESEAERPETSSKKKYAGSAKYKVAFKSEWKALHPIEAVKNDIYKFHCLPCGKNLTCHHQGLKDVEDHCKTETHRKNNASWKKQPKLSFCKSSDSNFEKKVLNAEVMVKNFIVQHNLPIATADHLGHLFKKIFPDLHLIATTMLSSTVRLMHIVLDMMDLMTVVSRK